MSVFGVRDFDGSMVAGRYSREAQKKRMKLSAKSSYIRYNKNKSRYLCLVQTYRSQRLVSASEPIFGAEPADTDKCPNTEYRIPNTDILKRGFLTWQERQAGRAGGRGASSARLWACGWRGTWLWNIGQAHRRDLPPEMGPVVLAMQKIGQLAYRVVHDERRRAAGNAGGTGRHDRQRAGRVERGALGDAQSGACRGRRHGGSGRRPVNPVRQRM